MSRFRLLEAIGEVACTAPYEDGWDDPLDLPDRNFYMWVGDQVVEAAYKEGYELILADEWQRLKEIEAMYQGLCH